jgi:hypothetical protein
MLQKKRLVGAAVAGALGLATLVAAGPASAYVSGGVYVGPSYGYVHHHSSCWHWSYGHWANFCQAYGYHYAHPYYGPYDYGYAPYYGPSIGFSFGFGGDHYHHHH